MAGGVTVWTPGAPLPDRYQRRRDLSGLLYLSALRSGLSEVSWGWVVDQLSRLGAFSQLVALGAAEAADTPDAVDVIVALADELRALTDDYARVVAMTDRINTRLARRRAAA